MTSRGSPLGPHEQSLNSRSDEQNTVRSDSLKHPLLPLPSTSNVSKVFCAQFFCSQFLISLAICCGSQIGLEYAYLKAHKIDVVNVGCIRPIWFGAEKQNSTTFAPRWDGACLQHALQDLLLTSFCIGFLPVVACTWRVESAVKMGVLKPLDDDGILRHGLMRMFPCRVKRVWKRSLLFGFETMVLWGCSTMLILSLCCSYLDTLCSFSAWPWIWFKAVWSTLLLVVIYPVNFITSLCEFHLGWRLPIHLRHSCDDAHHQKYGRFEDGDQLSNTDMDDDDEVGCWFGCSKSLRMDPH